MTLCISFVCKQADYCYLMLSVLPDQTLEFVALSTRFTLPNFGFWASQADAARPGPIRYHHGAWHLWLLRTQIRSSDVSTTIWSVRHADLVPNQVY
jgi:hypothetical protein